MGRRASGIVLACQVCGIAGMVLRMRPSVGKFSSGVVTLKVAAQALAPFNFAFSQVSGLFGAIEWLPIRQPLLRWRQCPLQEIKRPGVRKDPERWQTNAKAVTEHFMVHSMSRHTYMFHGVLLC